MTNSSLHTHIGSVARDVMSVNGSADASMDDVEDESLAIVEELQLGGEKKLKVLGGASSQAASFQIMHEDHTLGNSLRYFINKNPDVEFCGYTIPHPSEPKMNIRIQTWEDSKTTAFDALRKGLRDLMEACDVVEEKFTLARDAFGPPGKDKPQAQAFELED